MMFYKIIPPKMSQDELTEMKKQHDLHVELYKEMRKKTGIKEEVELLDLLDLEELKECADLYIANLKKQDEPR